MTILDKHPAPWRHREEFGDILDANGEIVARAENGCGLNLMAAGSLILAVPELLAHQLRCPVWLGDGMVCSRVHPTKSREDMLAEWLQEGDALIARIEDGK